MVKIKGTCVSVASFSTRKGPGLQMAVQLDKDSAADPDVTINLVAYSKLVKLLQNIKVNDRIDVDASIRNNSSQKDSVYFLATYINRPQLN
jgi:hypothetical protein